MVTAHCVYSSLSLSLSVWLSVLICGVLGKNRMCCLCLPSAWVCACHTIPLFMSPVWLLEFVCQIWRLLSGINRAERWCSRVSGPSQYHYFERGREGSVCCVLLIYFSSRWKCTSIVHLIPFHHDHPLLSIIKVASSISSFNPVGVQFHYIRLRLSNKWILLTALGASSSFFCCLLIPRQAGKSGSHKGGGRAVTRRRDAARWNSQVRKQLPWEETTKDTVTWERERMETWQCAVKPK